MHISKHSGQAATGCTATQHLHARNAVQRHHGCAQSSNTTLDSFCHNKSSKTTLDCFCPTNSATWGAAATCMRDSLGGLSQPWKSQYKLEFCCALFLSLQVILLLKVDQGHA
jgi:hypothetical protein